MTSKFKLTLKELVTLMEARSHEALEKYKDLGGSDGLAKKLDSNPEKGLSGDQEDIQSRKQAFGVNFIPPKKAKSFWQLALDACEDPTLIILIICAFISIALATYGFMTHGDQNENLVCFPNQPGLEESSGRTPGPVGDNAPWLVKYAEFIEGFAILMAILVVILVTAYNDWSKEKQFRSLQDKISEEQSATVIRNGQNVVISVADVVVGDVVQVKYGDLLPADGMLIASNDLQIDESSLTGESDHVKKSIDKDPSLLAGTHVMEGSGKMIVTAVGPNSASGIIFMLLGAGEEQKN